MQTTGGGRAFRSALGSHVEDVMGAAVDLDVSSVSAEEAVVEVDENHVAVAEPEFLRLRGPTVTRATGDP